ncbi:MAG: NAD-dependent epimerase/dehydratase family protein [Pyrinomonadaceae bacterium]
MSSLFITGATGFVGRSLARKIDPARFDRVYCLSRGAAGADLSAEHFEVVRGSLSEPETYAPYLKNCETVVHLAATTGKAAPEEYFRTNADGTRLLVEGCEQAGVRNFLYVSTIAVKYPDKTRYYYAQSKEQGEAAVRRSSMRHAIVRPTIVIGKGAPVWQTLSKIGRQSVLLMPGDGTTKIQPIDVEDLAESLLTIIDGDHFANETYELGGPERITFEHLLKSIHRHYHRKDPSVIHLPLWPMVAALSLMEKLFSAALPVSVGQLSAFANDGTAEVNRIHDLSAPRMKSVGEMLRRVTADE